MRKFIKSIFFLLIPLSISAQQAPVTSQYVLNPLSINPAYAGNRGALNLAAFYRKQWTGIPGAPETVTFAADAPFLDSKLGLGFILTSDKIGVTKETHFMTNYSYKISTDKGILSFGLGAGLVTTNTKWSDLVVLDPGDENYLVDSRVFVLPDFSFGVYYTTENFYAGFSIPKLVGYKFDLDKSKYNLQFKPGNYNYLLNAGYTYALNEKTKLLPSALVGLSSGEKIILDLNGYVSFNDRFWVGASYRNKRSVGVLAQFAINNQLKIAYTYDFVLGKLGLYSNGSHEIMLRYEFRYRVDAVSPLNF
jgi:type IX secretion system PorP/SprF family membrane protein